MNLLGSGRESLAAIPAVHRFLDEPAVRRYEFALGRENVKRAIAGELDDARSRVPLPEYEALLAGVIDRLERERTQTLLETINATGVMLHTNLGRAPLAPPALDAIRRTGGGYSNLEFDLQAGTRGSRHARVTALLTAITGAPDALVVNNCAAAVLLILDTLAKGREAIVARNQLIEIGGGFRLPDVLERSGARLVEVGATNKVYLRDYE
ncbi:MAG: L-seryl-tRNA(Sec) selenium transferase, partial [Vulcanimicrobiaceae bacterium]